MNNKILVNSLAKYLSGIILLLIALRISTLFCYLLIPLLVYAALNKRAEFIMFILMLITTFTVTSNAFFVRDLHFYAVTRISFFFFACILSMKGTGFRAPPFMQAFYWLYGYVIILMLTSFRGWMPLVSELKGVLFLAFFTAFIHGSILAYYGKVDFVRIRLFMLAIATFFIVGSIAVIPFPRIGKSMMAEIQLWNSDVVDMETLNTSVGLFNGVTWHSQTLGPTLALLNAFLLADYLFNVQRRNWYYRLLLVCVPVLIYMTSSRTALVSYLISILFPVWFFLLSRKVLLSRKRKVIKNLVLGLLVCTGGIIIAPGGVGNVEAFLRKGRNAEQISNDSSLKDDFLSSREQLVENGIENFLESPLIGNGFQVSKQMQGVKARELSDVISAPIEKGVLAVMILEEGGIFGAMIFIGFLFAVYFGMYARQFYCFLSAFSVLIVLNSGEAVFFSTSSIGGLCWMVCFVALLMDIERLRLQPVIKGRPVIETVFPSGFE